MPQTIQQAASPVTLIDPPGLYDPSANGYSHVAVVAPGSRIAHIAGQGGEKEDGALDPDFRQQARQALENVRTALAAVGGEPRNIAKLTVLIVDHTEARLHVFGEELVRVFGAGPKPACTLIPVPRLALDGMLFEAEAVAVLPAG